MRVKILSGVLLVITAIFLSACTSENNDNKSTGTPSIADTQTVTDTPVPTAEATDTPIPTAEVTDTPVPTTDATETPAPTTEVTDTPIPTVEITDTPVPTDVEIEGEKDMPTGKWYDKNGSTILEFKGSKMYAIWWSGMEEPEEYDVAIEDEGYAKYIINTHDEYGKGFGIMSRLEIREDGTLSAYEEILDGESHNYKFVPEDKIEEERAVKDFSTEMPKVIESRDIKNFQLTLSHYYIEDLGEGTYSWEIKKNEDGKYVSEFSGMGPSYVIIRDSQEVDNSFIEGVLKLLDDEKVAENNGMFFSHDENDSEYYLYITFDSREKIYIRAGSKALDKWPLDNKKFIDYAMSIISLEDL